MPAVAAAGVQVATATASVSFAEHVTVVHVGAVPGVVTDERPAPSGHVAGLTAVAGVVTVLQVVAVQSLDNDAAIGVQLWTGVGPLLLDEQVTLTHWFDPLGFCAMQEDCGRFV